MKFLSGLIILYMEIVEGFMEPTGFIGQDVNYVVDLDFGGSWFNVTL